MSSYELNIKASLIQFFKLPVYFLIKLWSLLVLLFGSGCLFLSFLTIAKPSGFTLDNVLQTGLTYFNGLSMDQLVGAFLIANIIWYFLFLIVVMARGFVELVCYEFGLTSTTYLVLRLCHVKSISVADSFLGPAKRIDELTKD